MKNLLILVFFGCIYRASGVATFYSKVTVNEKDALCLDGSPGVYYISTQDTDPQKILLFFEGGAWCAGKDLASVTQSCYQRSKTDLGSSKGYHDNMTVYDGILSNEPANSFKKFTKVFVKYCDGSGHQGTKSSPIQYKGSQLYFRGNNLTISKLEHLQKQIGLFSKSKQVLVTGSSAGGLAAFTWVDYIRNRTKSKNVYAVPDSGIFLDMPNFLTKQHNYLTDFYNLFKISNIEIMPPLPQCIQVYKNEPYRCMLVEYMHRFIQSPIFPVQSLYDSYSLRYILGIPCVQIASQSLGKCSTEQRQYIEQHNQKMTRILGQIVSRQSNGAWAPACVNHGYIWTHYYTPDYNVPMLSNNTVDLTIQKWLSRSAGSYQAIDSCKWPENKPCSGLAYHQQLIG